jgi:hypothetical protein
MNLLPPPTDNLYKFCAITGVLIIAGAFYIEIDLGGQLFTKVAAVELASEKSEIELRYLQTVVAQHKETLEGFRKRKTAAQTYREGKVPVIISEREFADSVEATSRAVRDHELKFAEVKSGTKESRRLTNFLYAVWVVASIAIVLGFKLARFGFRGWNELQKLQDKILVAQAKSISAPSSKSRST